MFGIVVTHLPVRISYNHTTRLFTKNERSDYSAITTWGIFTPIEGKEMPSSCLMRERQMGFPRT